MYLKHCLDILLLAEPTTQPAALVESKSTGLNFAFGSVLAGTLSLRNSRNSKRKAFFIAVPKG